MIVGDITELDLVRVIDRGIPNTECIAIRVNEAVNLGQFGIMIGVGVGNAQALPIRDNLFWFGDVLVQQGDWIFVYSGAGDPRLGTSDEDRTRIISVHWGRPKTMFANSDIVPILFRIDSVAVTDILRDQLQLDPNNT